MNLMCDALTVLGSRLGIGFDPVKSCCYLIRHNIHPGIPFDLSIGIEANGRCMTLPFTKSGENFEFVDQQCTMTTIQYTAIAPREGIKIKAVFTIPFMPGNEKLSTAPVIYIDISTSRLAENYRWKRQNDGNTEGRVFVKINGEAFNIESFGEKTLNIKYKSPYREPGAKEGQDTIREAECCDQIAVLNGKLEDNTIYNDFSLEKGEAGPSLSLTYLCYDEDIFTLFGKKIPFKYKEYFASQAEVYAWAVNNHDMVLKGSKKVDSIIASHTLGDSVTHLMCYAFHSWLADTWWLFDKKRKNWFVTWEGTCYYHSTVDVEYTQAPFYLNIWPELLQYQLHQWMEFTIGGTYTLGECGKDTIFLAHDIGIHSGSSYQYYSHYMEIEENANFLIMAYAYWRRSGDNQIHKMYSKAIKQLMDFIVASDTTGNGIPDKGCANTIDDAFYAIQYAQKQVYLGVKAMAACQAGTKMLIDAGYTDISKYEEFCRKALETIEEKGWSQDHYVVALRDNSSCEGYDAYHIYTLNGLALLDMVGFKTGLNEERLKQDVLNSYKKTIGRYGCRHSSYIDSNNGIFQEGVAAAAPKAGWVSMNMLRDIAAGYRGVDLFSNCEKYWDWQAVTNTQQYTLFFETFYGNNLHFYPRGIAVFGYFDGILGYSFDKVSQTEQINPIRASLTVPLLRTAQWDQGKVATVATELNQGQIICI